MACLGAMTIGDPGTARQSVRLEAVCGRRHRGSCGGITRAKGRCRAAITSGGRPAAMSRSTAAIPETYQSRTASPARVFPGSSTGMTAQSAPCAIAPARAGTDSCAMK